MIVPPTWYLPEAIRVRLGQSTFGRQRAIVEEGHLLLILHKPPGPNERSREGLLFWRSPSGEWQFSRGGPGPGALKRHVQSYADLETKLAQDYEHALTIIALFDLVEALTPLLRSVRNMHLALQTARESLGDDPFLIEMRDQASDIERNVELLLEDTRNEIQLRTARKAEEQAELSAAALQASHRLNILAALFFPLTAIASLFGMNLAHGLSVHSPLVFWFVLLVGCALGYGLKAWVLAEARKPVLPKKPGT